ncbi:MAG TPA: hypothetical protein VNY05_25300 [Candidatus Acidoferrales bacterium]|jgi:hypothetical protein|nr:hypothetical protein [Candidatus Acidoferrales bacterium]
MGGRRRLGHSLVSSGPSAAAASPVESTPTLGPGLLEPVYVLVLAYELEHRRLLAMCQHLVLLVDHGVHIEVGFRAGRPSRRGNKRLGMLINLKVALIKDGITRVANGLAE